MRFRRVEVVTLVLIAAVVAALLFPFLLYLRTASRARTCEDRLARLALAAQAFDAREGHLPGYQDIVGSDRVTGWPTMLLPDLSTSDPEGGTHLQNAFAAFVEDKIGPTHLPELLCPAQAKPTREAPLSYVANCGIPDVEDDWELPPDWQANGLFFQRTVPESRRVTTSLEWLSGHDGQKATLLFAENVDALSWRDSHEAEVGFVWVANMDNGMPTSLPTVWPINQHRGEGDGAIKFARPASEHGGFANVVMASGAVQPLSEDMEYLVFQRLMTADGANVKAPNVDEFLPAPWRHKGEAASSAINSQD